ncbi:response regulator [Tsuneonella sp. HG222]
MSYDILYVDDEPDLREIAQMSLELDPHLEVRCCASGEEALRAAAERRPDLVLLDVMMPSMDGPQTLKRLQEDHGQALAVVFITARAGEKDEQDLRRLGARGVIAKPFDPMDLARRVKTYLADV